MADSKQYNPNAQIFESQFVIRDSATITSSTSGGLVVEGGIAASKDAHIKGDVAVNEVKITPNLGDIVKERQQILDPTPSETWVQINDDFKFDNNVTRAVKAMIFVKIAGENPQNAVWEINGVYNGTNWVYNANFTGDVISGLDFRITDETVNAKSFGKVEYKSDVSLTIRYRATTSAEIGHEPSGIDETILVNTSGSYIPNALFYATTERTVGYSADLKYNNGVLSVGSLTGANLGVNTISTGSLYVNGVEITSNGAGGGGIGATGPTGAAGPAGANGVTGPTGPSGVGGGESLWITGANSSVSYTSGQVTVNDMNINGNLTVLGTTTTINTTDLYIEDHTITLNAGPGDAAYSGVFTARDPSTILQNDTPTITLGNLEFINYQATLPDTFSNYDLEGYYDGFLIKYTNEGNDYYAQVSSHLGDGTITLTTQGSNLPLELNGTFSEDVSFYGQRYAGYSYDSINNKVDFMSSNRQNQEFFIDMIDIGFKTGYGSGINVGGATIGNLELTGDIYKNGELFVGAGGGGTGPTGDAMWTVTSGNVITYTTGGVSVTDMTSGTLAASMISAGNLALSGNIQASRLTLNKLPIELKPRYHLGSGFDDFHIYKTKPLRYYKDSFGRVHIDGSVIRSAGGPGNFTICNLPLGYRPTLGGQRFFAIGEPNLKTPIIVSPESDGNLNVVDYPGQQLILSLSFISTESSTEERGTAIYNMSSENVMSINEISTLLQIESKTIDSVAYDVFVYKGANNGTLTITFAKNSNFNYEYSLYESDGTLRRTVSLVNLPPQTTGGSVLYVSETGIVNISISDLNEDDYIHIVSSNGDTSTSVSMDIAVVAP